jgi:hypothetical protein
MLSNIGHTGISAVFMGFILLEGLFGEGEGDWAREGPNTTSCCVSVPMGVYRASTQHTRMSCTSTCISNTVSMSI